MTLREWLGVVELGVVSITMGWFWWSVRRDRKRTARKIEEMDVALDVELAKITKELDEKYRLRREGAAPGAARRLH
jgi:hypothetical protein